MPEINFRSPRFVFACSLLGAGLLGLALHWIEPDLFGNLVKLAAGLIGAQ